MRFLGAFFLATFVACTPPPAPEAELAPASVQPSSPYTDSFVQLARYTEDGFRGPEFVEIQDVEVVGGLVLVCAATQGLLIVDRQGEDLPILAKRSPNAGAPRCQHVAAQDDVVLISNRGDEFSPVAHVTAFDISDPSQPVEIANLTSSTLSFEGLVPIGNKHFAVALHQAGIGVISLTGKELKLTPFPDLGSDAWDFAFHSETNLLLLADGAHGVHGLQVSFRSDPPTLAPLWHTPLEGAVRHVEVDEGGGVIFASAGTPGVHVLTIAGEPITTIDTAGTALMSAFDNAHLYVADWTEARVFDVSDLSAPRLVATENIAVNAFSRVLAIDAIDDHAYIGEWTGLFAYQRLPWVAAPDIKISDYGLVFPKADVGEESASALIVSNVGTAKLEIFGFSTNDEFVALQDELTLAPGESEAIELRFRPTSTSPSNLWLELWSDDPDETRLEILAEGNAYGLGVGDAIPDYQWLDLQTTLPLQMRELRGSVVMLAYFATF